MKKVLFITAVASILIALGINANANGNKAAFNKYEIIPVEHLHLAKNVQAVWTISYSADEQPVTIVKRKSMEGTEYIVQSEYFAVAYVQNLKGFGARKAKRSWSKVPAKINRAVIDSKELARQEIITPNKVSDEQALALIASYLPDLLNDGYSHLLN